MDGQTITRVRGIDQMRRIRDKCVIYKQRYIKDNYGVDPGPRTVDHIGECITV